VARGTTVGTIARKSKRAKSVERRGGRGGVRGTKVLMVMSGEGWIGWRRSCVCVCVYM